jgi:hypothetical protein
MGQLIAAAGQVFLGLEQLQTVGSHSSRIPTLCSAMTFASVSWGWGIITSGGVLVLVVEAPPGVRRVLRAALRRVLPFLLTPERRQIEEGPHAASRPRHRRAAHRHAGR